MKNINITGIGLLVLILSLIKPVKMQAQNAGCQLLSPGVIIDFGNNSSADTWKLTLMKNYTQITDKCPDDGYLTKTSYTQDCFSGHWHTITRDHSTGDGSNMLIVNASLDPGPFYIVNIAGLNAGATYQLSSWIANVCKVDKECVNIPPLIEFSIECRGRVLKRLITGNIYPAYSLEWKQFAGFFDMPADETAVSLKLSDLNRGGCGNDFVMDDISFRECKVPEPEKPEREKPIPINNALKEKEQPDLPKANKDEDLSGLKKTTEPALKPETTISKVPQHKIAQLPAPLANRANPVIKQIVITAAEMRIELYDNGQIDGDTISVYHNNELVLSKAGLSAKPLVLKIKIDEANPHHELVMVAENLGSIPPNTSLMIVTANDKRYEIFISSSKEKNARIVIDLKK